MRIGSTKNLNIMRIMPPTHQQVTTEDVVTAIHHHHIVEAYTGAIAPKPVTVLHMLYPRTDVRTHRSLDALVNALHQRGLHQVAEMVKK